MCGVPMESVTQRQAEGRCLEICPTCLEQLSVQMICDGDPDVLFNWQEMRVCICRDSCINFMEKLVS